MSPARLAVSVLLGFGVAFVFLQFWMRSAQYSWSSDDWVHAIPVQIVVSVLALIALAIRWLWSVTRKRPRLEDIDPNEPIYELHVNGEHVATLYAPEDGDMFWCSYRIEATNAAADAILRDGKTWETVNFTIKDANGEIPNPNTFSGGYDSFCARETDRLSFRSLWPPQWTNHR